MAVSKKRKKSGRVVRHTPFPVPVRDYSKGWTLKIKPSQIIFLKDDPDFLMLIKFGRAINALSFGVCIVASFARDQEKNLYRRQYRRGLFVLAGYLHQTINIIRSVGERHNTMEAFVPLRKFAHSPDYKKARGYFKTIRNYTAFHLDEGNEHEHTRESLGLLDPSMYVLMGSDDDSGGTFYFEFADYLDFQLVGKTFQDERTPKETMDDITGTIIATAKDVLDAAHGFQLALAKKMELHEYIYS